jgi:hypothetical protein
MRFLSVTLVSLIFVNTIPAQWAQTSLDSATIFSLAMGHSYLFAGTNNGVFRSSDNGAIWIPVDSVYPRLAVVNGDLFAERQEGLFLTTDDGVTWSCSLPNIYGVTSVAASDSNIYASLYAAGLHYSSDRGGSWNYLGYPMPEMDSSHFGHGHWVQITALEASGPWVRASGEWGQIFCDMCPPEGYFVIVSTNNGTNWITSQDGGNRYFGASNVAFIGTRVFLCRPDSGVFLSTDNGINWSDAGTPFSYFVKMIQTGSNLFAATGVSVFLSTNDGKNWTEVDSGFTDSTIVTLTASDSFLFVGTENSGVWHRPLSEMITSVEHMTIELPHQFSLHQNYPNPFNPSTTISYQIPKQSHVTLRVFDVLGREVATLLNSVEQPGYKSVNFHANNLVSGVYYYRLQAGSYLETKKLLLLR